jgi:hypothetical protein
MNMTLILSVAFLILTSSAPANAQTRHDGVWWNNLQPDSQTNVVIGVIHGAELASILSSTYSNILSSDKNAKQLVLESTSKSFDKYIAHVEIHEIVDGLNTVYRDLNNRNILLHHAIYIILEGIHGMSQDTYKRTLETIRELDR